MSAEGRGAGDGGRPTPAPRITEVRIHFNAASWDGMWKQIERGLVAHGYEKDEPFYGADWLWDPPLPVWKKHHPYIGVATLKVEHHE